MIITIELPAEVGAALEEMAVERRMSPEGLARLLISQGLFRERPRPWAEIVAPIAADFAASGMTEEDLDALVEEAREEIYFERHGRRTKQP